jgi:hypothetical protein
VSLSERATCGDGKESDRKEAHRRHAEEGGRAPRKLGCGPGDDDRQKDASIKCPTATRRRIAPRT